MADQIDALIKQAQDELAADLVKESGKRKEGLGKVDQATSGMDILAKGIAGSGFGTQPYRMDLTAPITTGAVEQGGPLAGAMWGGSLGLRAPVPPPWNLLTAVGGAGLGGMLGQQGANALQTAQGNPPPDPMTRTAKAGIAGMEGEMTGQGIGNLLKRFIFRGMTPETKSLIDDAGKFGIPLTAGERTGEAGLSQLESYPARFPLGVGPISKFIQSRRGTIQGAAEGIVPGAQKGGMFAAGTTIKEQLGGLTHAQGEATEELVKRLNTFGGAGDRVALGEGVQKGLWKSSQARRKQADAVYDAVEEAFGDAKGPADSLHAAAARLVKSEASVHGVEKSGVVRPASGLKKTTGPEDVDAAGLSDDQVLQLIKSGISPTGKLALSDLPAEFVKAYGLDKPRDLDFKTLRTIQSRLGELSSRASDDVTRRKLLDLHKAVSKDIDVLGEAGGGDALRQANQFYKEEVASLFGRKTFLRGLMDVREPEQVVERLLASDSPSKIRAIIRTLPMDKVNAFRGAFMDRLHDSAIDPATGRFVAQKWLRAIDGYSDDTLRTLLGPDKLKELQAAKQTLQRDIAPSSQEPLYGSITKGDELHAVGKILRPGAAKDIESVFRHLDEPVKQQARRAAWQDIMKGSVDQTTNTFSMRRFLSQVKDIDDPTWKAFLGKDAAGDLGTLKRVLQRIESTSRMGENTSETARGLGGMAQISGAAYLVTNMSMGRETLGSAATKGIILVHPWLLGKLVTSPGGIKLLSRAMEMSPGTEQAIKLASQIAAQASN